MGANKDILGECLKGYRSINFKIGFNSNPEFKVNFLEDYYR